MKKQNSFVYRIETAFSSSSRGFGVSGETWFFFWEYYSVFRDCRRCAANNVAFIQTRFLRDVASRPLITPRRLPRART